jgi:hypothetical protein
MPLTVSDQSRKVLRAAWSRDLLYVEVDPIHAHLYMGHDRVMNEDRYYRGRVRKRGVKRKQRKVKRVTRFLH